MKRALGSPLRGPAAAEHVKHIVSTPFVRWLGQEGGRVMGTDLRSLDVAKHELGRKASCLTILLREILLS